MKCKIYEARPGQLRKYIEDTNTKYVAIGLLKGMFQVDRISRTVQWLDKERYIDQGSQYIYGIEVVKKKDDESDDELDDETDIPHKTIKQVKEEHKGFETLIDAIYRQIGGMNRLTCMMQNGDAGIGWAGFIYYSDTCKFARRWRVKIVKLLEEDCEMIGCKSIEEMVDGFNCFKNKGMDHDDRMELYRFLGGNIKRSDTVIPNLMAWYALEEVAKWFRPDDY